MGTMISVSVIFETGENYLFSSIKRDFVDLEDNMYQINIKGIAKGLRFMDLVLLIIISGVKVNVCLSSGLKHITFLG